jgi:hypothetical protein
LFAAVLEKEAAKLDLTPACLPEMAVFATARPAGPERDLARDVVVQGHGRPYGTFTALDTVTGNPLKRPGCGGD